MLINLASPVFTYFRIGDIKINQIDKTTCKILHCLPFYSNVSGMNDLDI